jgi:hypothetical protein
MRSPEEAAELTLKALERLPTDPVRRLMVRARVEFGPNRSGRLQ